MFEELDDAFRRHEEPIPTNVKSREELKQKMIDAVNKNDSLSEARRQQIINNIRNYDLAGAAWEQSDYFQPTRIAKLTEGYLPEWEGKSREVGRVKTEALKGRFEDILSSFETPSRIALVSERLAALFGLMPSTLSRDVYPLVRAGYLELVERGVYRITDRGREILESL